HHERADRLHEGDARERARGLPAIDGERQRAADARVVEGLPFVVQRDVLRAEPARLLDDDPIAEGADHLVPRRGREAAELGVDPPAPPRGRPGGRVLGGNREGAGEEGGARGWVNVGLVCAGGQTTSMLRYM